MHIPDGFLSAPVATGTAVVAAGVLGYAVRRTGRTLEDRQIPLLGVTAAFVFAAQMLNFPVAGGTSGHFLGAALATVLLGPWLALIVLSVVVTGQALVFADGGLTAIGAEVIAMGVVGCGAAWLIVTVARRVAGPSPGVLLGATAVASWVGIMLAAATVSVLLAASGTIPLGTVLPAMLGVHALIGIGEALITTAAVAAVLAARPDLVAGVGPIVPALPARPAVTS